MERIEERESPVRHSDISSDRIGYLYLVGNVIFNGSAFHLIKAGLRYVPTETAVLVHSLAAVGGILLVGLFARILGIRSGGFDAITFGGMARRFAAQWRILLPATAVGLIGGWLNAVVVGGWGPELAAFLTNLTLVFLVLGGVLRGDRLAMREWGLVAVVIAGAFLFSWTGHTIAWLAIGIMVISCATTAAKQIMIKEAVPGGNLWELMALQQILFVGWAVALAAGTGNLVMPPPIGWAWLVAAGIIQNFIGMGFLYAGYHRVGVARGAPIYAMRPLVVLVIGLLLGAAFPGPLRLLGGAMVLVGSAIVAGRRANGNGRTANP